jgi:4-hydroxy-2-oxoheptanedioate aldolase
VFAQIESVKGVKNVEEIAALENVHGLMFGPGDFMADAGIPMTLAGPPHPTLIDAMDKFVAAGRKYDKSLLG